jgi:hypothetical protein
MELLLVTTKMQHETKTDILEDLTNVLFDFITKDGEFSLYDENYVRVSNPDELYTDAKKKNVFYSPRSNVIYRLTVEHKKVVE